MSHSHSGRCHTQEAAAKAKKEEKEARAGTVKQQNLKCCLMTIFSMTIFSAANTARRAMLGINR